jgi:hypothetical protein
VAALRQLHVLSPCRYPWHEVEGIVDALFSPSPPAGLLRWAASPIRADPRGLAVTAKGPSDWPPIGSVTHIFTGAGHPCVAPTIENSLPGSSSSVCRALRSRKAGWMIAV